MAVKSDAASDPFGAGRSPLPTTVWLDINGIRQDHSRAIPSPFER